VDAPLIRPLAHCGSRFYPIPQMHPVRLGLTKCIGAVVCLAAGVGCGSSSPAPGPSPPLPPAPIAPPAPGFSLAGKAHDTARRPLPEVLIQVVEGASVGLSAVSDLNGQFEFPGTFTGAIALRAEKPGYSPVMIELNSVFSAAVHRDIFLQDVRTADLTGEWTLTLTANESCEEIPGAVRTRRYMASVGAAQYPPGTFDVQLRSPTLVSHWTNTIQASVSGADAWFNIPSWDWGVGIAERVDQSGLFVWGVGYGSVSPSTIVGDLAGGFEYTDYSGAAPVVVKCESFQLTAARQ